MLLVIFGAGASYDSDPDHPPPQPRTPPRGLARMPPEIEILPGPRPPLANQLFAGRDDFEDALDRFPQCKPLIPQLRHLRGSSVEARLERFQEDATGEHSDAVRVQQLAAIRFYIQGAISECDRRWLDETRGITNYLALLDQIRHYGNRDVLLVTFNYDRLLEAAVLHLTQRAPFSRIDDYLDVDPFAIFKIHGSVDWGRVVAKHNTNPANDIPTIATSLIADAATIEVSNEFRIVSASPLVRDAEATVVLFPAIAIPVQTKQHFECPPNHLEELRRRLRDVDRILIIGWRGLDRHFTAELAVHITSKPTVHIVNGTGPAGEETLATLSAARLVCGRQTIEEVTFTDYVLSEQVQSLFAR